MSNRIVIAFKNQIVVLVIVIGAIIVAIPVFILSLIRLGWELGVPGWHEDGPVLWKKLQASRKTSRNILALRKDK